MTQILEMRIAVDRIKAYKTSPELYDAMMVLSNAAAKDMDPELAARTVFAVLARRITEGEIEDIRHLLPAKIRNLWPGSASANVPVSAETGKGGY